MPCVTLTKSRKLACTSKMAGVAIGIAAYDSLNRVVQLQQECCLLYRMTQQEQLQD
jgi:hypothetical protein